MRAPRFLGDLGNVIEALDVLDVQRGVHVDAGAVQFFDIHVALRVATAGCGEWRRSYSAWSSIMPVDPLNGPASGRDS
jgi:hypothetical protein